MTTVVTAAALVSSLLLQPTGAATYAPLVLQVTYSDGRTVPHAVGPLPGHSWSPMFPRVPGWIPPKGVLPATAVEYRWMRKGAGVRVSVWLRFGQPHQEDRLVANAIVSDVPVRISELRAFGVEPVELSLAAHEPISIAPPAVVGKTTGLEIVSVEPQLEPVPLYLVTVRNVRDVGVLSFRHEWYLNGTRALSGRQGERNGEPIVGPRGTFVFAVSVPAQRLAADQAWRPRSLDALAITSILWADWAVEGEDESAATTLVLQLGRRVQLRRVVQIYREVLQSSGDAETVRQALTARLETLPRLPDVALVGIARTLHASVESLSSEAIEGVLASGLSDVREHSLRVPASVDSARRPLAPSTLAGLLRDGLVAAERWLATVNTSLPR